MNKFWLLGATFCMVLAFSSCKSKESAYKAAYEAAKEKETSAPVVEDDFYASEPEDFIPVEKPRPEAPATDTRMENISAAEGEDANRLKRYSVVVGSFQNRTNAYSLKDRMVNDGYDAVLGENEQGMLRVIVSSFDNKSDAVRSRDNIKAIYAPNFQDAWILEKAY